MAKRTTLNYTFDPEADAVYITLADKPYAYGKDLDHERRIDYAADETPIGIELLSVSEGVDMDDLPRPEEIARVLEQAGFRQFA